jgi:hypothetical protein
VEERRMGLVGEVDGGEFAAVPAAVVALAAGDAAEVVVIEHALVAGVAGLEGLELGFEVIEGDGGVVLRCFGHGGLGIGEKCQVLARMTIEKSKNAKS